MNTQEPKVEGVAESVRKSFNGVLPQDLSDRMRGDLDRFRAELKGHPYVHRLQTAKTPSRLRLRLILRWTLASVLALTVAAAFSESARSAITAFFGRSYGYVDALVKARLRGDADTYNKFKALQDAMEPPAPENASIDRFLGISPDRSSFLALAVHKRQVQVPDESGKKIPYSLRNAALWSIDINTGECSPVAPEKVLEDIWFASYSRRDVLEGLLYFIRPKSLKMEKDGSQKFEKLQDDLWFYDLENSPARIDSGKLANRWMTLSPDRQSVAYVNSIGEVIRKIATGETTTWLIDQELPESGLGSPPAGMVMGWTPDSQNVVTSCISKSNPGGAGAFGVVSLKSKTTIDSLADPLGGRGSLNDADFNGSNHFYFRTRDSKYFTESHEDTVRIFSIRPLRLICELPGTALVWTPDGKMAILANEALPGPSRSRFEFGVIRNTITAVNLESGTTETTDMGRLFPNPSGDPDDSRRYRITPFEGEGDAVSPDSKYLTIMDYGRDRNHWFALLNLQTRSVARTFDGFHPEKMVWSPNSTLIAARSALTNSEAKPSGGWIFSVETGEAKNIAEVGDMRPRAWLDEHRVLWTGNGRFAVTDLTTGEAKIVPFGGEVGQARAGSAAVAGAR